MPEYDWPIETIRTEAQANYASEHYKHLVAFISAFEASLDPEYEVGLWLVPAGEDRTIHLESIGYANPSLIMYFGTTDLGHPTRLIQNVHQISLQLIAISRGDPDEPRTPIGFMPLRDEDE